MATQNKWSWWNFKLKVRYLKVRGILWYHEPNNSLYPGKYAHHLLILFYPFWDEKDLLSGCFSLYQNKLLEPGVQTMANSNKIKFEPFGNLVDDSYSRYNANMLDNQDPLVKLKMMKQGRQYVPMTKMMRIQNQKQTL